jgi:hypothetical protein
MATYSQDGQTDDLTGGDAGAEEEFGDQPWSETAREAGADAEAEDPDTEDGRRMRPSPDSPAGDRIGPD